MLGCESIVVSDVRGVLCEVDVDALYSWNGEKFFFYFGDAACAVHSFNNECCFFHDHCCKVVEVLKVCVDYFFVVRKCLCVGCCVCVKTKHLKAEVCTRK